MTGGKPPVDPAEDIMMRPSETYFSFDEYLHMTDKRRFANEEGMRHYLQKHSLFRWPEVRNDMLPALMLGKNNAVTPLAPEHFFLWMTARAATNTTNELVASDGEAELLGNDNLRKYDGDDSDAGEKYAKPADVPFAKYRNRRFGKMAVNAPIHSDPQENLHLVIRGAKIFKLYHPMDNEYLYESASQYHSGHVLYEWSPAKGAKVMRIPLATTPKSFTPFPTVNITAPQLDRFPLFAKAKQVRCEVFEGDVLYLPSNWWHEVMSFENEQVGPRRRRFVEEPDEWKADDPLGQEEMAMMISLNQFWAPYYTKLSDMKHYQVNPVYSHIGDDGSAPEEQRERLQERLDPKRWGRDYDEMEEGDDAY
jgi:hypothetical protein